MGVEDPVLVGKLMGAVVAFALGVWIGLGMPGVGRSARPRGWHPTDRLRATWINRAFFRMDQAPRRFDASRLIVPKSASGDSGRPPGGEAAESEEAVRLRRPDQG
jgi:hypothetical protein